MKRWMGLVCSALVVLLLLADASVHLFMPEKLAGTMASAGFPLEQTATLGLIVLVCAVLYAIPATAFIGAILVTGFWGGAVCTHFRMQEMVSPPAMVCVAMGILVWAGLYLRDARVRSLVWGGTRSLAGGA